jgi:hypothetical protein
MGYDQPHTPVGQVGNKPDLPYEGEAMIPGHGDKRKREAHELSDAVKGLEEDRSVFPSRVCAVMGKRRLR